jgi:hypothetical protein
MDPPLAAQVAVLAPFQLVLANQGRERPQPARFAIPKPFLIIPNERLAKAAKPPAS